MASLAALVLACPASTMRGRDSRARPPSIPRFSVSRDRSTSYGRAENVRHFGSWRNSKPNSSPLSARLSELIHPCSRASLPDASAPTNARGEPLSGGGIVAESDYASAARTTKKQQKMRCLAAATPDASNRFQPGQPAPNSSMWKLVGRCAACAVVAFVLAYACLPRAAHAVAENSIGASSLGRRVADYLRGFGLRDELVVVIVGALPVLELRGAIPVGYWLKMEPFKGYALSVIGNMIPVPFIVLYLEKILQTVGQNSETGLKFVRWFVDRTRKKAAPIEEFEWLGLCLFVAVPLPGTGAWTGAIAASILGMPLLDAVTANFFGVVLAGLLVTLLVRVGTREAVLVGLAMIISSCFVWSVLRLIQPKNGTSSSSSAASIQQE